MAQLSGTPEHLALKEQIWETMDQINPEATDRLRQDLLAGLVRHASPRSFAAATRSRQRSSASTKRCRQRPVSWSSVRWTVRRLPMSGYSTSSSRLRHAKPSFSETRREASFPSKYFKMIVSTPS